uniref:Uncharacterized protein n=1 Tax=Sus scrofa TaxID=9823 RepID=A0A8D0MJV8_PIG
PKSHKSSGSYGDSVVVEEEITVRGPEKVALEKAKRQTKKKKKIKQDTHLEKLKAKARNQLTKSILRQRIKNMEERGKSKILSKELDRKDKACKKQTPCYPSQLSRLKDRQTTWYKAFTEQYRKIKKETEGELRIWHCHELCCRLQAQVIQCSRENT